VAKLTLPIGTYTVTATAKAMADDDSEGADLRMFCGLWQNQLDQVSTSEVATPGLSGKITSATIAMTGVATFSSPGTVDLGCFADPNQHLEIIHIVAIKVGTVHVQ
jgi:hypothetical protein